MYRSNMAHKYCRINELTALVFMDPEITPHYHNEVVLLHIEYSGTVHVAFVDILLLLTCLFWTYCVLVTGIIH